MDIESRSLRNLNNNKFHPTTGETYEEEEDQKEEKALNADDHPRPPLPSQSIFGRFPQEEEEEDGRQKRVGRASLSFRSADFEARRRDRNGICRSFSLSRGQRIFKVGRPIAQQAGLSLVHVQPPTSDNQNKLLLPCHPSFR